MKIAIILLLTVLACLAQTNSQVSATNHPEAIKARQRAADAAEIARLQAIARVDAVRKSVEANRRLVHGKVIQKIKEGLLISSGAKEVSDAANDSGYQVHKNGSVTSWSGGTLVEGDKPGALAIGYILLQDYPAQASVVDDHELTINAYPVGQFVYDSVGGAKKTIRRFTASLPIATELACIKAPSARTNSVVQK